MSIILSIEKHSLSWNEIREVVHPIGLDKRIMRLVKSKPSGNTTTPSKDIRFALFCV